MKKKMKQSRKALTLLLCLLCSAFLLPVQAFAAGGTLTLNYEHDNTVFNVYRVADIEDNGAYTLSGDFACYSVAVPGENLRDTAATLAAYAARDKIEATATESVSNGTAVYSSLESGLYLVVGEAYTKGSYTYTPVPFLIEVNATGDVSANVKYERESTGGGGGGGSGNSTSSYTVTKVWKNDEEAARPDSVIAQLLKDGTVYDSVTLNSENSWSHTWNNLSDSHRWQVAEESVAQGYTVSVSQSGTTFTVTNTYSDSGSSGGNGSSGNDNTGGNGGNGSQSGSDTQNPSDGTGGTDTPLDSTPKTGDETHLSLYLALMLVSLLGLAVTAVIWKKTLADKEKE